MAIKGAHHVTFISSNMKAQIEFCTQVIGMRLTGLFPMHGVEGETRCFLEAGENCCLNFVEVEGGRPEQVIGICHSRDMTNIIAGGAMQHIAFELDSMEKMYAMRDLFRNAGFGVLGPPGHSLSESMYTGAPEGVLLEFVTVDNCEPVCVDDWVSADGIDINEEELALYINQPARKIQGGAVPQPEPEVVIHPAPIPKPMFEKLGYLADKQYPESIRFQSPRAE